MNSPVIVALDKISANEAIKLTGAIAPVVWGVKVNDLLLEEGISIIKELKAITRVFADPKLHDIPNTVGNSVARIAGAGADLITVHASGGPRMIAAAVEKKMTAKVLAVTALTSLEEAEAERVYGRKSTELVKHLGELAIEAGADGLVSSPQELSLKFESKREFIRVTPGIRPKTESDDDSKEDDQRRTATPKEAVQSGADLVVIGRPITEASNPLEAAKRILESLR